MIPEKEVTDEFKKDGYPPPPRTEVPFTDDDINFKKFIVTPQEPVEYVKDNSHDPVLVYELPAYVPTMALGNLDAERESAMRCDFFLFDMMNRLGYHNIAKRCYRSITDRIISSQSLNGTVLTSVTEQRFSMRREEYPIHPEGESEEKSPMQGFIEKIKGQPAQVQQKVNQQQSRFSR